LKHILSIQSHVVYGHAGNAAAVFPLQRLGHCVSDVNLLQFSNHTGYASFGGSAISANELVDVFEGLKKINVLEKIDCIITGYIGSEEQVRVIADFIVEAKKINPSIIYCCDPVMGDYHTGMYVKSEVASALKNRLVPLADIITPNKYELSFLADKSLNGIQDVLHANKSFIQQNKKLLITSAIDDEQVTGIVFQENAQAYSLIQLPKFDVQYTVRGTGDVLTALFMGNYLQSLDFYQALEQSANTLHAIVEYSHKHNCSELPLIECQEHIVAPLKVHRYKQITL
jgi:pyridoxine kinase